MLSRDRDSGGCRCRSQATRIADRRLVLLLGRTFARSGSPRFIGAGNGTASRLPSAGETASRAVIRHPHFADALGIAEPILHFDVRPTVHCCPGLGVGDGVRSCREEHRRIVLLFHDLPPVEEGGGVDDVDRRVMRRVMRCSRLLISFSTERSCPTPAMRVPRPRPAAKNPSRIKPSRVRQARAQSLAADSPSPIADAGLAGGSRGVPHAQRRRAKSALSHVGDTAAASSAERGQTHAPRFERGDLEPQEHRWGMHARTRPLLRRHAEPERVAVEAGVPRIDLDEDVGDLAPAAPGRLRSWQRRRLGYGFPNPAAARVAGGRSLRSDRMRVQPVDGRPGGRSYLLAERVE